MVFSTVAASLVSCTYDLGEPDESADPKKFNVKFDGTTVPQDTGCTVGNGWYWNNAEHTSITFCDGACNQLKTGKVDEVKATYGCETVHN